MSSYTVRVELINASSDDYNRLHSSMELYGYNRFIIADDGTKYHLPTAEYVTESIKNTHEVREQVSAIANGIRPTAYVFVTQASHWAWYLKCD